MRSGGRRWGFRWAALLAGAGAAALAPAGCSFLTVRGPHPKRRHPEEITCTTSYGAPILDSGLAILGGVGALRTVTREDSSGWTGPVDRGTYIGLTSLQLLVAGASAIYGFSTVNECDEALAAQSARFGELERLRSPLGDPPPRAAAPAPGTPSASAPGDVPAPHPQ